MDRRNFLLRAMAAVATLAVDPEELLWKPKLISIPKPRPTIRLVAQIHDEFIFEVSNEDHALDAVRYFSGLEFEAWSLQIQGYCRTNREEVSIWPGTLKPGSKLI